MDINLEFSIFSKVFKEELSKVKIDISERTRSLSWVYSQKNLDKTVLKRANTEESHLKLLVSFILATETVFSLMEKELKSKSDLQIDWYEEWARDAENHKKYVELMVNKYKKLKDEFTKSTQH